MPIISGQANIWLTSRPQIMNTITVLYIDCQIIIKKLIIPLNKTGLLSGPVLREYEIDSLNNESYNSVQSVSIYQIVADHTHPLFSRLQWTVVKHPHEQQHSVQRKPILKKGQIVFSSFIWDFQTTEISILSRESVSFFLFFFIVHPILSTCFTWMILWWYINKL